MSKLPDLRLVNIVESASQYEAEAVAAAREELARRQLRPEQLAELKATLADQATRKALSKDLQDRVEQEVLDQARSAGRILNPFMEKRPLTILRLLGLYLLLTWTYFLLREWSLITFLVSVPPSAWDVYVLWVITNLLLLPLTAVLLWRLREYGWILATAYFLQGCIGAGLGLYWNWQTLDMPAISDFFSEKQVLTGTIQLFLNLAVLTYLNRTAVIALFGMDRSRWWRNLIIALAICLPLSLALIQ